MTETYKELKIDDVGVFKGKQFICKKSSNQSVGCCNECVFSSQPVWFCESLYKTLGFCVAGRRSDTNYIVFKEVDKE